MSGPEFEGVLDDLEGLDDRELRDLIERSHQIQAMANHPGWEYFKDYLIAVSTNRQKRILTGYCKTIEEYRYETGFIQGLQEAFSAPNRLFEKVERASELARLADAPEE